MNDKSKNLTVAPIKVGLEEYLKEHDIHIGLVASFRYEALGRPELLEAKTDAEWTAALQGQSAKHY